MEKKKRNARDKDARWTFSLRSNFCNYFETIIERFWEELSTFHTWIPRWPSFLLFLVTRRFFVRHTGNVEKPLRRYIPETWTLSAFRFRAVKTIKTKNYQNDFFRSVKMFKLVSRLVPESVTRIIIGTVSLWEF